MPRGHNATGAYLIDTRQQPGDGLEKNHHAMTKKHGLDCF